MTADQVTRADGLRPEGNTNAGPREAGSDFAENTGRESKAWEMHEPEETSAQRLALLCC